MDKKDIGALWLRKSNDGKEYMSGTVTIDGTVHEVVVFKNGYKKDGDKTPDWRVYPSTPRPEAKEEGGYPSPDADTSPDSIPF